MQQRFKLLRKALGLSQEEFANKLGLTRGAITNIELGKTEAKPLFISLVCSTFNVNETWLRTGEGEMFNAQTPEDELAFQLGRILGDGNPSFKKRMIAALAVLNDDEWAAVEAFARKLVEQSCDSSPNKEED